MKFNYSIKILLVLCVQLMFSSIVFGQQQPSIDAGVTFFWQAAQANNNSPSRIDSININGTSYNLFVVPTAYQMTQLGPGGNGSNSIVLNGTTVINNSGLATWPTFALAAFQDRNLNHYFQGNPNGANICGNFGIIPTTPAQKQSLIYTPGIPVNRGGVVAITERGGNNCFHIAVFGTLPGSTVVSQLGQTFCRSSGNNNGAIFAPPAANSDYWRSGRTHDNNQTICIGLFYIDSLAAPGSTITRVQLTAASNDHGDGKFFILQKYAVADNDTNFINSTLYDDVSLNDNVPVGSVYQVTSPPSPGGGSFIFNPDGSFEYTPPFNFVGIVTFEYEVCLPFPNNNLCDQAIVVIVVLPDAGPNRNVCIGSSVTMGANGNGVWTASPGNPGTASIVSPNSPTTSITNFSATGTYTFLWSDNGFTAQAQVFVTTVPPLPNPIGIGCE